jgi:hypothetical protein
MSLVAKASRKTAPRTHFTTAPLTEGCELVFVDEGRFGPTSAKMSVRPLRDASTVINTKSISLIFIAWAPGTPNSIAVRFNRT